MRKYKLKIISLAFGSIFLNSCSQLLYTSLDVLRPAKVAFAPEANNLLLVNNTVTQPADYGHKTELLNEKEKSITIPTDSIALFCLSALTEELNGKDFFASVQMNQNSINPGNNFATTRSLSESSVKNLCNSVQADVLLSLDKIEVKDKLSEYYLQESSTYLTNLEVKYESYWSIYYPNKTEAINIQFKDSVFWESESYSRRKALSDMPDRSNALIDGALYVGQNSVKRFIPYWEKADRYFFNPRNKQMRQGMDSVYVKNWKAAISHWKLALEKSKKMRIQAEASNNIAIAYEILGDIDKAIEYTTQSLYTFGTLTLVDYESFNRISGYLNELTQRKKDNEILKQQLGE